MDNHELSWWIDYRNQVVLTTSRTYIALDGDEGEEFLARLKYLTRQAARDKLTLKQLRRKIRNVLVQTYRWKKEVGAEK